KATLAVGVVSVVLGAMVLAWPGKTILVAAILFGVYLLVTGIGQVILALSLKVAWGMRLLPFISGATAVAMAVLCFLNLQNSVLLLAIWIAVGFIFRGVATTSSAFGDLTLPGRVWGVFVGVISLVAGIVMLAAPFDGIATLTLVAGIWLVVVGAFEIVSSFFGIRSASKPRPNKVATSPTADVEAHDDEEDGEETESKVETVDDDEGEKVP
ncbi:HdeD family acid-resistance protein, partial [Mycobacteroides chelonae]